MNRPPKAMTITEEDDRFVITIPKEAISSEDFAAAADYLKKIIQKKGKTAPAQARKLGKILVVDDFALARNLITQMLVDELKLCSSSDIDRARNGKEAIAKLLSHKDYEFIISDWNMPEMDGYELLKLVRGDENLKTVPFLMVTCQDEIKDVKMALQAGVSGYILKPFTAEKLREKLQQMQLI